MKLIKISTSAGDTWLNTDSIVAIKTTINGYGIKVTTIYIKEHNNLGSYIDTPESLEEILKKVEE